MGIFCKVLCIFNTVSNCIFSFTSPGATIMRNNHHTTNAAKCVGNIVRFCKEDGARYVKACEINDTLRNSLYNECNVIAPDFLTVQREQVADITYIIMNPPFSSVEKHILHAWEVAPYGCTILALCPSSRFSHCYGDDQKLKELADLYGSREELGDVFNTSTAYRIRKLHLSICIFSCWVRIAIVLLLFLGLPWCT